MGVIVKPLGAYDCHHCVQGWHMTVQAVAACERRAAVATSRIRQQGENDGTD